MKRLLTLLLAALLSTAATLHAQEIAEITPPAQAAAETQEHPAQSRPTTIVRRVPGDQDPGKLNANETAILDPQTDEWVVSRHDDMPPARSLADLYLEGGWEWMSLITICLIAMLFSAWKAPRWIKEFGLMALSLGIFSMSVGLYSVFDLIQATGISVSFTLLCGGLRVALLAPMYGLLVYILPLMLRLASKPRI